MRTAKPLRGFPRLERVHLFPGLDCNGIPSGQNDLIPRDTPFHRRFRPDRPCRSGNHGQNRTFGIGVQLNRLIPFIIRVAAQTVQRGLDAGICGVLRPLTEVGFGELFALADRRRDVLSVEDLLNLSARPRLRLR